MAKRIAVVVKNEPPEVTVEVLAKSIKDIAEAARKLLGGPLTERAVFVLIRDALNGVGIVTIEEVLKAAARLDRRYLKAPATK